MPTAPEKQRVTAALVARKRESPGKAALFHLAVNLNPRVAVDRVISFVNAG